MVSVHTATSSGPTKNVTRPGLLGNGSLNGPKVDLTSLHLTVWPLSGVSSRRRDFRKKLPILWQEDVDSRQSTLELYTSRLKPYFGWYNQRSVYPYHSSVTEVAEFLHKIYMKVDLPQQWRVTFRQSSQSTRARVPTVLHIIVPWNYWLRACSMNCLRLNQYGTLRI